MSIVERLASQLEHQCGTCPAPRPQLLAWVDDQLTRCKHLGVPGEVALAMISTGYIEWRAQMLGLDLVWEKAPAVGKEFGADLEREQPADQEREELFPRARIDLRFPDDFEAEQPKNQQPFEGDAGEKSD